MIKIRPVNENDAESLSYFLKQLDDENQYLLYDSDERKNNPNIIKNYLHKMLNEEKSCIFVAENANQAIVGFICGEAYHFKRLAHIYKVNIGVLKKYHGLGLGRQLGKKCLIHAKRVGILRIEVTIIKSNMASLNLSKKFGLELEGIKRKSIKIDNQLYDEYLLAKLL